MVFLENEVRKMYRLLRHSGFGTVLHCQNMQTRTLVDRRTVYGEEEVVKWAREFNGRGNCFIGRNPRDKNNGVLPFSISLDFDPIGAESLEEKGKQEVWGLCRNLPGGSYVSSGRGAQIIFAWGHASTLGPNEFRQASKAWTDLLRQKFKSEEVRLDAIHDPERLIKLTGTISTKGDKSLWKPARFLTYCLEPADHVLKEIETLAIEPPKDSKIVAKELGYESRSEADFGLASFLKAKGYTADQVYHALANNPAGKHREDDYKRIVNKLFTNNLLDKPVSSGYTNSSRLDVFLEDSQVIEWIVPGFFARKSISFVAGLPETMKTWLLIDLAIECAKGGGLWLKKFPTNAAKVLFIDQERFKGETQRRFKAVVASKNLAAGQLPGLFVRSGSSIKIDNESDFEMFKKELSEIKPDLVIIDSFATFHTKEENNRKDIQEVLERVKILRNEFGCSFIFIDHENKSVFHDKEEAEPPSAFRMAGSVAKPAAAETVLTVRKQDASSSFVYHTKSTLAAANSSFLVKISDLVPDKSQIQVEAV